MLVKYYLSDNIKAPFEDLALQNAWAALNIYILYQSKCIQIAMCRLPCLNLCVRDNLPCADCPIEAYKLSLKAVDVGEHCRLFVTCRDLGLKM